MFQPSKPAGEGVKDTSTARKLAPGSRAAHQPCPDGAGLGVVSTPKR